MKTLLDIIKKSDDDITIKKYIIGDREFKITAKDFQRILNSNYANSKIDLYSTNDASFIITNKGHNIINIKISFDRKLCQNCYGTGQHYCYSCKCDHECAECEGLGYIYNENEEENEIALDEDLNLNQGELFN